MRPTISPHFHNNSVCVSSSGMAHSLQPRGLKPAKLHYPWKFLGKNTGVGCHYLLQGIFLTQGLNLVSCTADRFFTVW